MLPFIHKESNIDSKGRFLFPSTMRKKHFNEDSKTTFILLRGISPCVEMYSHEMWEKKSKQLEKMMEAIANPQEKRRFLRMYAYQSTEGDFDSIGRVLIPKGLVEYAKIKKEIIIQLNGENIEIWSKELFEADNDQFLKTPEYLSDYESKILQNTNND